MGCRLVTDVGMVLVVVLALVLGITLSSDKPGPVPPSHHTIGASADLSGTSAKRPDSVPVEDCVVCHTPLRQAKGVNMLPCAHLLCVSCTLHLARTKPITMQVGVLGSGLSRICVLTTYMVDLHRRDDHHLHQ